MVVIVLEQIRGFVKRFVVKLWPFRSGDLSVTPGYTIKRNETP
jgi:hypothetical protein